MKEPLSNNISYLSQIKSHYDPKPNLVMMQHVKSDNGDLENNILQIDSNYHKYRAEKLKVMQETKYDPKKSPYQEYELIPETRLAVVETLVNTLIDEYPLRKAGLFALKVMRSQNVFMNASTGDTIIYDPRGNLITYDSTTKFKTTNIFEALTLQFQEDFAVLQKTSKGDYLTLGHVAFPSKWALSEKIGKSFTEIHQPVGGMDHSKNNKITDLITGNSKANGVRVRFGVSLDNSADLNAYKESLETQEDVVIDPKNPSLFLRIERQVVVPLPQHSAGMFLIKTYVHNIKEVPEEVRQKLAQSVRTMEPTFSNYKGLQANAASIAEYISNPF